MPQPTLVRACVAALAAALAGCGSSVLVSPPEAPTSVVAVAGNTTAEVSWVAPANGGSPITGYVVTPRPAAGGRAEVAVAGTTATLTSLVNGTHYSFSVAAVNALGTGPAALSNEVVPGIVPTDGGSHPDAGSDAGSNGGSDAGSNGGSDAGSDAGSDVGSDGGSDAGSDGGSDAGSDGGSDAGSDAGSDGGSDAGSDAGSDGGSDAGSSDGGSDAGSSDGGKSDGGGVASATLCQACSVNNDCAGPADLCLANPDHSARFCAQDCTNAPCPAGYSCTTNSGGTTHQCMPSDHVCPVGYDGGTDAGTSDAGSGDGGPSTNPNGCKTCGQCQSNDDCITGAYCVNSACAAPCNGYIDCVFAGLLLASCSDVGLPGGQKVCLPLLGQCMPIPGEQAPLAHDFTCTSTGTNPSCTTPIIPAPALGANVAVTQSFSPKPLLATGPSLARDSKGNQALGFIGVDGSGNSYAGVAQSVSDGASWLDKGKMRTANQGSVQGDPVLAVSKWTDPSGTHERLHYAWVSYKTATSAGQTTLQDMYAEAAYSDDGGATWSNGALVTTSGDNGSGTLLVDKPWLVAGPDGTLVYTFSVGDRAQQHLYASVSVDHGQSWGPKQLLYGPTEGSDNASGHNLAMPVFDPSDATGKTLYAVYVKYTATAAVTGNSVQLTKSTDRGLTWTALGPVSASTDQVLFDAPSVAMDGSKHLYVGYTASPQGGDAKYWDALVATIDVSASTPVVLHRTRASDDQASCFQHFHATVQADSASGKVFVAWLDNRNNGKGGVYYAVSTDQGASFSVNRRISDADFTFNPDRQNAQLDFLGDYFGLLFDGTRLRAAWSDPRNGNDAQVIFASGTP